MHQRRKLFNVSLGRRNKVFPHPEMDATYEEQKGNVEAVTSKPQGIGVPYREQGRHDTVTNKPHPREETHELAIISGITAERGEPHEHSQEERSLVHSRDYFSTCKSSNSMRYDGDLDSCKHDDDSTAKELSELYRTLHLHQNALSRLSRPVITCNKVYGADAPAHIISLVYKLLTLKVKIKDIKAKINATEEKASLAKKSHREKSCCKEKKTGNSDSSQPTDKDPSTFVTHQQR